MKPLSDIIDVVVDEERNIMYTRSANSTIQVYDLGSTGTTLRKVAEVDDILAAAKQVMPGLNPNNPQVGVSTH